MDSINWFHVGVFLCFWMIGRKLDKIHAEVIEINDRVPDTENLLD